jgi:Carboxypeptidase regulatory-like domain
VTRAFLGLILTAVLPWTASAQVPDSTRADSLRSSIAGTVRDSLGFPVSRASVLITPGGFIYTTDSAGKFNARNIPPGALTIGVRKLGFSPLQSRMNLHVGVELALDLVMQRLPQMLAEVEVKAQRQCPRYSLEGILCRQEQGFGTYFMNRQDILEKAREVIWTDLLLRDAPGFRQNLNGDPRYVESTVGWRCVKRIVDGGFPYRYNPVQHPKDVYAIEVYQPPDIPLEYRHWYWNDIRVGRQTIKAPCTLVVMWTMTEAQRLLRRMGNPK